MQIIKRIIDDQFLVNVKLGDIHLGNNNCDKRMVENVLNYIKTHKCTWLGMGDYADAITPSDPRFDYRSIDRDYQTPQDQYAKIYDWFKPIKNKCLGLLDGNHDILHWKKHAHNYVKELAEKLDVEYLTIDAFIRLYFSKFDANYDIYAHHGWTGSRTKGAKIMRIYDLESFLAHEYDMGHIHDLGLVDKKVQLYVDKDLEIKDRLSWYVLTGGFLRGYVKGQVSYVEEKTYRPTALGSPVLTITPIKGKTTVSFNVDYKDIR